MINDFLTELSDLLEKYSVRQQQEILDSLQQGRIEENERILSLFKK